MKTFLKRFWQAMTRPSVHFSLAFLTLGGFICGIIFWGGFNTALEATNTERFCIGCHEMESNVYAELQTTVHWNNSSGVRAECPDCHVPHDWTNKIARKVAASKEVYGWIFGTIDTEAEFEAHRLEMAQREWARFRANDSLECRNCHAYAAMDFAEQSERAAEQHQRFVGTGEKTCIECHAGIAHRLPDIEQAGLETPAALGTELAADAPEEGLRRYLAGR